VPNLEERVAVLEGRVQEQAAFMTDLRSVATELRHGMRDVREEIRHLREDVDRRSPGSSGSSSPDSSPSSGPSRAPSGPSCRLCGDGIPHRAKARAPVAARIIG
jgi:uncharacterized coiled-coil protein SlyX